MASPQRTPNSRSSAADEPPDAEAGCMDPHCSLKTCPSAPGSAWDCSAMRAPAAIALMMTGSCLQVGTDTGTGTGTGTGTDGGRAIVSSLAAHGDGGLAGTSCSEDPVTKAILCEKIDACPGVDVDPGAFPDCGYAMRAGAQIDLECLCGTALCPIGVPVSCQQAKALLDAQNAFIVCAQQADGRCVELAPRDAATASPCDPSCRDECAGAPSCIQLCGC
jgi:hypothetical protein